MRLRSRRRERVEPGPARSTVVACAVSAVSLLVAGAGLFAITSSGTTTSLVRMGVAAGILAGFSAAVGGLVLPAPFRTVGRRWACAFVVPGLVGLGTGLLVGARAGVEAGALATVPWLAGALVGGLVSPYLPDLSLRGLRQRREERSQAW